MNILTLHTQHMYSNSTSANKNIISSPQNNNVHPHNQSTVILQQFSMITQELRNFTEKLSGDINKITQKCTTTQENTCKLIENEILQGLTKPKKVSAP